MRVFISSTFLDLEEERDFLVKVVFPRIRKLCRQRNIEFTEVDLRWGVTEEESKQGKVIHICLSEIDRSYPYFIGILGERYGWIPTGEDLLKYDKILDDFGWIRQDVESQMSITEMEIQYGVLRNERYRSDSSPNAFFYIKTEKQNERKYNDSVLLQSKLEQLKQHLRQQKLFPVHPFASKEDLGQRVAADLERIINERFPAERPVTYREKVLAEHIQHAIGKQHHFIGNQGFLSRLNHFYETDGKPMVITGESGCGKTALLANWIRNINENHPDTFLFFHFCGGASDSTNHIRILQRLLEEVKFHFGIETDIPSDAKKIIEIVPEFLARAQRPGERWLLLIDGINQVEDVENARLLNWLPEFFPSHISVVFSCLEGDSLNVLKSRDYQFEELSGINLEDRKLFIPTYLEQYGKKLSLSYVNLILSDDRSENPLFLKTLLEEVRIFGVHEKLGGHIQRFLDTNGIPAFFDEVLLRMEEDYEENQPGMVGMVLSLIFVSRAGLSEKEILEITGIKALYWSHFLHIIEAHMVTKSGLFNFGHDYLKFAAERRYLPDSDKKKTVHKRLAVYFEAEPLSQRSLVEYPYHLVEAGDHDGFIRYISDPDILARQIDLNKIGLMIWITKTNRESVLQKTVYHKLAARKRNNEDQLRQKLSIAEFFYSLSYFDQAIGLTSLVLKFVTNSDYETDLEADALYIRGNCYHSLSKYNNAINDLETCLKIERNISPEKTEKIARTLNQLGFAYHWKCEYKRALSFYRKSINIRKKLHAPNSLEIANSYNHFGLVYNDQGEYKKALNYFKRSLRIRLANYGETHPDVAECYGNIGLMYHSINDFSNAEYYYFKAIDTGKTVFGEMHSEISAYYNNLGLLYQDTGELDKSLKFLEKSLSVWQLISKDDSIDTAISYNNIGWVYLIRKNYIKALEYYERDYKISIKEFGEIHQGMVQTYSNLTKVYYYLEHYQTALDTVNKCLTSFKKGFRGVHPESIDDLSMLGLIYLKTGRFSHAKEQFIYAQQVCHKKFGKRHLYNAMIYENLGQYYIATGDRDNAEYYYKLALSIWDKKLPPIHYETADTLLLLGELYLEQGRGEEARKYLLRAQECFEHYQILPEIERINTYLLP